MIQAYPKTMLAYNELINNYPNIMFKKFSRNSSGHKFRVDVVNKAVTKHDLDEDELDSLIKLIKSTPQTL